MDKGSPPSVQSHKLGHRNFSEANSMKKILIKFATRGRPNWFIKAIANIFNTVTYPEHLHILVTLDDDDDSMNTAEIKAFMDGVEQLSYHYGKNVSKIEAINRDMDKSGDWDILVNMSDDMQFVSIGWDNTIRQFMEENFPEGDCFLHFDDGYVREALATMTIIDRKYYLRDGYIYHPSYKSFSCDAEAYFVAVARKRHKYFPMILARHQHPANAPVKNDKTYQVNSLHTPHDTHNYWARLHRDFDLSREGLVGPYPWDIYKRA